MHYFANYFEDGVIKPENKAPWMLDFQKDYSKGILMLLFHRFFKITVKYECFILKSLLCLACLRKSEPTVRHVCFIYLCSFVADSFFTLVSPLSRSKKNTRDDLNTDHILLDDITVSLTHDKSPCWKKFVSMKTHYWKFGSQEIAGEAI